MSEWHISSLHKYIKPLSFTTEVRKLREHSRSAPPGWPRSSFSRIPSWDLCLSIYHTAISLFVYISFSIQFSVCSLRAEAVSFIFVLFKDKALNQSLLSEWLAQGHPANIWLNWDQNQAFCPLKSSILLSYQDIFWKKVGCRPMKKLIKHLTGLWTILRGFLFNFPFPFFLILLGTLGSYSELSQGHSYILDPEITEFITSSKEEVMSMKVKAANVHRWLFKLPLLPSCQVWRNTLKQFGDD